MSLSPLGRSAGLAALAGFVAGSAGIGLGGRHFLHAGFSPSESALLAAVLTVYLIALTFPSALWAAAVGGKSLLAMGAGGWLGVTAGMLLLAPGALAGQILAAQAILAGYAALLLALAAAVQALLRTRSRTSGGAAIFLSSLYFFTSPYYTGGWADSPAWGEWGARLAVWSAAPATIGVGFRDFSFPFLPGVYRVWLGPICPLPGSWTEAMFWYLLPAGVLIVLISLFSDANNSNEAPQARADNL